MTGEDTLLNFAFIMDETRIGFNKHRARLGYSLLAFVLSE